MSTAMSRRVVGWALVSWTLGQAGAPAQEPPTRAPESRHFLEPTETHRMPGRLDFQEPEPDVEGQWETLPYRMPINPVHAALMHNGKVLIVSGSGNDEKNKLFQAAVWDPAAGTISTLDLDWDMFCNGMVVLPDGRPFIFGGTLKYDDPPSFRWDGEPRSAVFEPTLEKFVDKPKMSGGRWYPTGTVLGDGSVLVYSGFDVNSQINTTVQIWKADAWTDGGTAFPGVDFYPREHLLPDGKVFVSGWTIQSWMYDPKAPLPQRFTRVATTVNKIVRGYGTSVLLPLTPANGFNPRVMIMGGADNATATTELIDLSAPTLQWVSGPDMVAGRINLNATLLPDGRVLVSGGSRQGEVQEKAVLEAELYNPESNRFSSASRIQFPRLYHSNTLLLPDARVAAFGGNPARREYQTEIEIYSPPYLFNADGSLARRPTIAGVSAGLIRYGQQFQVDTPDAASIGSVVLIRPGAPTHAFDMEQRLVGLTFTASGNRELHVGAPAHGNLAPPGYYLLFLVDNRGVPSVGRFIQLQDQ